MAADPRVNLEKTAADLVDSAVKVHRKLGPGLLESAYQGCLTYEMTSRGHQVRTEVILPVEYESIHIDRGYRIDMLINDHLMVENKSVSALTDIHKAQVITYLKLSGLKLGFLINWNVTLIKHGIKRVANAL
jgi:GxxExxY protein